MGTLDDGLTSSRWDDEYRRGRYVGEPPLPFVSRISTVLKARPHLYEADGLYIGCGNGRNYLPLIDSGLRLYGLDVSEEALNGLTRERPDVTARFRRFHSDCFSTATGPPRGPTSSASPSCWDRAGSSS